jgi:hypothetical protein
MQENKKEPKPVEVSLGYIAWGLKGIEAELKKLNENIEKSKKNIENSERFF